MSEEDVREGLRAAVADEPPLVFDPDAVVNTARKANRRRALVAVGTATAAIAVVAVAIPAMNRGTNNGTTQVANQPPPTSVTTSVPPTWPPTGVDSADHTAQELRTRGEQMRQHLRSAVPALLPAASAFEFGEFGGEAAGDFHDGQNYVNAPVTFTVDGARYSIFVTTWAPGVRDPSPETVCGTACQDLGYRDGGPALAKTETHDNGTIMTAYHFRTNGGVVQIAAYNYDMTGVSPPSYMSDIPVTVDQLVALATDPELGL